MIVAADNLVEPPANKNKNYWSPLSSSRRERGRKQQTPGLGAHVLSHDGRFETKIETQNSREVEAQNCEPHGILDTGCTLGAGAQQDINCFNDTGEPSSKVFMLPNKTKIRATKKMKLKHNLRCKAGKMNIILNLHCWNAQGRVPT
jgi:hypothetical protein